MFDPDLTKSVVGDLRTLSGVRAELLTRAHAPPLSYSSSTGSLGKPRFAVGNAGQARAMMGRHASAALRDGSE